MSQRRRGAGALFSAGLAALLLQGAATPALPASVSIMPPAVGLAQLFLPDRASGLALQGFDPVSYFLEEGPQPGLPEYEVVWSGLAWRFASAANRDAFTSDPEAYAPQFGGYDASALAGGILVQGHPLFAAVHADRLYFFRNDQARTRFLADASLAEKAGEHWPSLRRELVAP
jgi:hypothetical protein